MDRAVLVVDLDSLLVVVFLQAVRLNRSVHLDPRHRAASASRSIDGVGLEVHAADGTLEYCGGGGLAFHSPGRMAPGRALALLRRLAGGALSHLRTRLRGKSGETHLPL